MGADPVIELASREEIPEIVEMLKECGEKISPGLRDELSRSTVLVAKVGGRIVGTRSYTKTRGRFYHVHTLFVRPEYRRRGLGEMLCREAQRLMYKEGAEGYFGEARSEKMAQCYVRTLGVRIHRLSFRGWRSGAVPYFKTFTQAGFIDSLALAARRFLLYWMKKRLVGRFAEAVARRIEVR